MSKARLVRLAILFAALAAGAAAPAAATRDDLVSDPSTPEESAEARHATADDRSLRLSLDPYASLETGADITYACAFSLGELEARYFPAFDRRPAVGPPVRLLRAVLLDAPLAWWFTVLQHEAFGHGGRAREFGADAGFHMGSPWASRSSYASFDTEGLTTEDLLRVYAGGSESNGWSATLLERELVAGRPLSAFELLYLAGSRLVLSDYVLRTTPDPEEDPAGFYREWDGGGDVAPLPGLPQHDLLRRSGNRSRRRGSLGGRRVPPAGAPSLVESPGPGTLGRGVGGGPADRSRRRGGGPAGPAFRGNALASGPLRGLDA